jgi:hypothetical protein
MRSNQRILEVEALSESWRRYLEHQLAELS